MAVVAKHPKGRRTRARILDAALALLAEHELRAVTLRRIAERAGTTPAAVLRYFPTREHVFAELLVERDADDVSLGRGDERPAHSLRAAVARNQGRPEVVRLFSAMAVDGAAPEHPAHEAMRAHYDLAVRDARDSLRERQRRGEFDEAADVERIARLAVAAADGLQLQWAYAPGLDMADALDELFALVEAAHGVPRADPAG